jgi:hypothetical protein
MNLNSFKQSNLRAWVWFVTMALSIIAALMALVTGLYPAIFSNLIITVGVYWINKLEQELTRRNKQAIAPLPNLEQKDDHKDS